MPDNCEEYEGYWIRTDTSVKHGIGYQHRAVEYVVVDPETGDELFVDGQKVEAKNFIHNKNIADQSDQADQK